jgi:hypothetical protein
MRANRAWVRLGSGHRLDLLDLRPDAWTDEDLATGLARTYRWGGHSCWELPLSVAQHSLAVLAIRERTEGRGLAPAAALHELLHDADEGLLGFDCLTPLKPHLDEAYARLSGLLRATIAERYGLSPCEGEEYLLHKRADRLAATSEALHVAGWSRAEIHEEFGPAEILIEDPLPRAAPQLRPWEPWPPALAARLFHQRLQHLGEAAWRERVVANLATAFAAAPERMRQRCSKPVYGNTALDTLVRAEAPNGEVWEGVVVAGEHEPDGAWALDAEFLIFTLDERPEGQLVTVHGWNCDVQSF